MAKNKFVIAQINQGENYWFLRKGHFNMFMPNLDMAELFDTKYAAKMEIKKRFGQMNAQNFRVLTVIG